MDFHSSFSYSFINGLLICYQLFIIKNNAAIIILKYTYVDTRAFISIL